MKKYMIYGLALMMAGALPAAAQDAADGAKAASERPAKPVKKYATRKVCGKVLNGATGKPMSGAIVSVPEVDGYSALTKSDGSYEMEVPTFASTLQVTAPEMNPARLGLTGDAAQRTVNIFPNVFHDEYASGTNVLGTKTTEDFRFTNGVTIEDEIQKRLGADVRSVSTRSTSMPSRSSSSTGSSSTSSMAALCSTTVSTTTSWPTSRRPTSRRLPC